VAKRRGNGEGTVWKTTPEDGRKQAWRAEQLITLPNGKRKKVSARGPTQRETLERLRSNVRRAMVANPAATNMTLEQRFEKWFEQKKHEIKASSLRTYRRPLEIHVFPVLGRRPFTGLTTSDFVEVLDRLRDVGKVTTAEQIRRSLKQMYSHAVRDGLMSISPVAHLGPTKRPTPKRGFWTPPEVELFLKAASGTRYRELFILALFAGLRRGELVALRWEDVGPNHEYVEINRTYAPLEPNRVGPPKTVHAYRRVPLGKFARDAIAETRSRYLSERRAPDYRDEGWLFASRTGRMPNDRNVFTAFMATIHRAQGAIDQTPNGERLPREIRFHDMRRIYASYLAMLGHGPALIQKLLGHATPDLALKVYTAVSETQALKASLEIDHLGLEASKLLPD
jgi:integrase